MDARQGAGRGRAALVGLERKKERGNGGGSASGGRDDDDDDDGRRDTDTPPSRPLAPFALSPSLARSLPPSLPPSASASASQFGCESRRGQSAVCVDRGRQASERASRGSGGVTVQGKIPRTATSCPHRISNA